MSRTRVSAEPARPAQSTVLGGELGVGQPVGHHHIGGVKGLPSAQGDEVGAARSGADQGDAAGE